MVPVDLRNVPLLHDTGSALSRADFTNGLDSMKKIHQRLKTPRPQNTNAKIVRGMNSFCRQLHTKFLEHL